MQTLKNAIHTFRRTVSLRGAIAGIEPFLTDNQSLFYLVEQEALACSVNERGNWKHLILWATDPTKLGTKIPFRMDGWLEPGQLSIDLLDKVAVYDQPFSLLIHTYLNNHDPEQIRPRARPQKQRLSRAQLADAIARNAPVRRKPTRLVDDLENLTELEWRAVPPRRLQFNG